MKYVDKSQEIKKALRQGGLVISERGTGKTKALVEILLEEPDAVIIAHNSYGKRRIKDFLTECGYGPNINKRVFDGAKSEKELLGMHKDFYIDEYFLNPYKGPFKGATTSFPFTVKVIK